MLVYDFCRTVILCLFSDGSAGLLFVLFVFRWVCWTVVCSMFVFRRVCWTVCSVFVFRRVCGTVILCLFSDGSAGLLFVLCLFSDGSAGLLFVPCLFSDGSAGLFLFLFSDGSVGLLFVLFVFRQLCIMLVIVLAGLLFSVYFQAGLRNAGL